MDNDGCAFTQPLKRVNAFPATVDDEIFGKVIRVVHAVNRGGDRVVRARASGAATPGPAT
jgi:hypothetical protein